MGCPAFSFACKETQAKHPETEQGFCKQAQASVTLSMGSAWLQNPGHPGARMLLEILRKDKGTGVLLWF